MNTFIINGKRVDYDMFDKTLLEMIKGKYTESIIGLSGKQYDDFINTEYINAYDTLEIGLEIEYLNTRFCIDFIDDEITDDDYTVYEDIKHYNKVNHTHWVRWQQLESDHNVGAYGIDYETGKLRVWHI